MTKHRIVPRSWENAVVGKALAPGMRRSPWRSNAGFSAWFRGRPFGIIRRIHQLADCSSGSRAINGSLRAALSEQCANGEACAQCLRAQVASGEGLNHSVGGAFFPSRRTAARALRQGKN
jgi:hypothetical protein